MILMPQIFNVTANENVRYKRYELEYWFPSLIILFRDNKHTNLYVNLC